MHTSSTVDFSWMMSGFKLYYFNGRGVAEICRLAFAAANIEYEDIRLDGEEWAKEKACEF